MYFILYGSVITEAFFYCGGHLETVAGDYPNLMKVAAEIVEREEEDLGENPHADHSKEGDRPQWKNEEICSVS